MALTLPSLLTVGETFVAELTDIAADSVAVILRGPTALEIEAKAKEKETWEATAETGTLTAGLYGVEVWATREGRVAIVARARVRFCAAANSAPFDPRSIAEQIVDAIDNHLGANGQDPTWASYRINNREMRRYAVAELLQLRAHYKSIVASEQRRTRGASVLGSRIAVRF